MKTTAAAEGWRLCWLIPASMKVIPGHLLNFVECSQVSEEICAETALSKAIEQCRYQLHDGKTVYGSRQ
jgi:hypothetical protein